MSDSTSAQEADKQIGESDALNRSLMEASHDSVTVLDLHGQVLRMNTAGRRAMEIDDGSAVNGQPWRSLWPADARTDIDHAFTGALGGFISYFQTYCPTKAGARKWWDVTVHPIRGAVGDRVTGLLAVAHDITERMRPLDGLRLPEAALSAATASAGSELHEQREAEREMLTEVLRQAPALICVLQGPDHVFALMNERYYEIVGRRDLLGRKAREALPELEGRGHFEVLDKVYQTGEPFAGANILVPRAGLADEPQADRYVDLTYRALRDKQGAITGILVVGAEVTDRQVANALLRTSEARYRALFQSMDQGYCVIDVIFDESGQAIDYRFLEVNAAFEKHSGLVGATGKSMRALVPDIESHWFDMYGRVVRTGEPIRVIDQAKAMEGRWFDVYAFRLGDSDSNTVAILFSDISDRMGADRALRESQERLSAAAAAVTDVIWTNTADGLMEGEQIGWAKFTGQSREEYQGYGWSKAVHPEDAPPTIEAWEIAVAGQTRYVFEHRVRRHDGEWRRCSIRAIPLFNVDGSTREWVGVHTDITDRMRDEEKLRQLAADLSEADHRKDLFLATLAHELRNPLAPIRHGLQLIKIAGLQHSVVDRAGLIIERQVAQMVRLIEDLMDVSRINQGKFELRKSRVPLSVVLESAIETSRPLIEETGIELKVGVTEQPLVVDADLTRLAQVFVNLLNNAAKYSDRGGIIELQADVHGQQAVVTVTDNGIGLPADQLTGIFDMFAQVADTLGRSQGGLGIGLSLVRHLVDMHGGTVEAQSEGRGKGSKFVVRLPVAEDAPFTPAASHEVSLTLSGRSLRILVVDDNRDGADTLTELLSLMHHEARTAYDGQEAVEIAQEFRPHLVLMDIGLPKLNGYEACRVIRQQVWGSAVVIIALSGWGQDADRIRSRDAGFDRHMVKPVDPHELYTTINAVGDDRTEINDTLLCARRAVGDGK